MKNTIEEFRLLFNRKMEEFIDWRLRVLSYQATVYAQKIVNSNKFDETSLVLVNRDIEYFLDILEKNLTNARPILGEGVDSTNTSSDEENIEEEI